MKAKVLLMISAAVAVATSTPLLAAEPAAQTAGFLKPPGDSRKDGVLLHGDAVFLVRNGEARKVDAAMLPPGQLLTMDGNLAPLPATVTGLGATGPARAAGAADSTAAPDSPKAPDEEAAPQSKSGLVMHGGAVFLVRNGQARRIDNSTVPIGQMMNFEGELVQVPDSVTGLPASPVVPKGNKPDPGE